MFDSLFRLDVESKLYPLLLAISNRGCFLATRLFFISSCFWFNSCTKISTEVPLVDPKISSRIIFKIHSKFCFCVGNKFLLSKSRLQIIHENQLPKLSRAFLDDIERLLLIHMCCCCQKCLFFSTSQSLCSVRF